VNASGLIEKERANFALSSNDISTQSTYWAANQGGTTTQNSAVAPDGTTTASTITANGVNTYSGVTQNIAMGALRFTYSVYLKATSGTPDVRLTCFDGVTFHQKDFTIDTTWQRYEHTFSVASGTNGIYITSQQAVSWNAWGAQLELGLVATDLIETTTAAVYEGITDNLPRLDYSGGASCPSLLLEPSRSNLIANSEYLASSTFFNNNLTITSNATTSPEGVANATLVTSNNPTGGVYRLYENSTSAGQAVGTASVFMKYVNNQYCYLSQDNYSGITRYAVFDLINGTNTYVSSGYTATITPYSDGWYRCTITGDQNTLSSVQIGLSNAEDAYTGNIANGQSVYFWGVQREYNSSYATSYIPTYGTSASRAEDLAYTGNIDSELNESEGTIFLDVEFLELDSNSRISISDNSYSNVFYLRTQSVGKIQWLGGDLLLQTDSGYASANTRYKVAFAYETNNAKMFVNGVLVDTDTSFTPATTLNRFGFDMTDAGINEFKGKVKQALIFPTKLTDAEAIALTTI
jgi:hypothetical protein